MAGAVKASLLESINPMSVISGAALVRMCTSGLQAWGGFMRGAAQACSGAAGVWVQILGGKYSERSHRC